MTRVVPLVILSVSCLAASKPGAKAEGVTKTLGYKMNEDQKRFEEAKSFVSSLGAGREAFHSEVTEYCLRIGERSPEDFMRHFSSAHIMRALTSRPTERARIVSQATGVHERVAHKMSPEASGEALQIAVDEKVATQADIVRLFQPDDRQRYLDRKSLWQFAVEGEPWKVVASARTNFERAKAFVAYIIERALANLLLSHDEIVSAVTVEKIAALLPREELGAVIAMALRLPEKFTESHLTTAVPPRTLADHLPLDYLWNRVVVPLVAERHEYMSRPGGDSASASAPAPAPAPRPEVGSEDPWNASAKESAESADAIFNPGDGDVVTVDDIIEEDSAILGDPPTSGGSKGSRNRKSAQDS